MIEVPSSVETDTLTDWAEASCLFGRSESISKHEVEESLDGAGVSNPEELVSDIWQEIDLRHQIGGNSHPVRSLRGRIERIQPWDRNLIYVFQLLLAMQSFYGATRLSRSEWPSTAKVFERLTTVALEHYLSGRAINIGAPRGGEVPSGFGECLRYLCSNLSEALGAMQLYTSRTRDDGVDVFAWRPFGDERPGQVIILAQCAAGADWKDKIVGSEISLGLWRQHINWITEPLKAFAFPFVCVGDINWRRLSHASEGLLLDRLRITSIGAAAGQPSGPLRTQLRQWCRDHLVRLPWSGL